MKAVDFRTVVAGELRTQANELEEFARFEPDDSWDLGYQAGLSAAVHQLQDRADELLNGAKNDG